MKLQGIFPPLTTPFDGSGALALDRLRENIRRYNATRLAGYVVIGSTGESALLTHEEVERVWAAAKEATDDDKILIAGTGVDSTAETIERTNRAAALGYHAALVKTPHYYKPQMTPQVLIEHYQRVADAARIPVLLYSVPQFTGLAVEAQVAERLAAHPNIIGIKESSGEVKRVAEIIQATPRTFQMLVGSAQTLYASLELGAVGAVLAIACALPELAVELYEAARAADAGRARSLQQQLLAPTAKFVTELGIPGLKFAMDRLGYYGGPARRPFLPLTDAQKKEVEVVLAGLAPAGAARVKA